ncbi:MAG TPA: hypothetical protein VKA46_03975 [Gemmataceae bacterium]|nr:hypothetical protein [Gemmataceae bacterium]
MKPFICAAVLLAAVMAPALGQEGDAPKIDPKNLGSGLDPVQQNLAGKAKTVVEKVDQAKKANEEAGEAVTKLQQAKADLRKIQEPPPPSAPEDVRRAREVRIEAQQEVIRKQQEKVTEKTEAAAKAVKAGQRALDDLKTFVSEHPTTRLPDTNEVAKQLHSHGIKLGDPGALRQLREVKEWLGRFDSPPGSGKGPLPDKKGPTQEFRDAVGAPKADPKREQKRLLDAEADAITAEATRIKNWRQDLQQKSDEVDASVKRHNDNPPDQSNESAGRIYNDEAVRLNRARTDVHNEIDRFNKSRKQLLDRANQFDERVKAYEKQYGRSK